MKALKAAGMDARVEFERQIERLPETLRDQVAVRSLGFEI
jgi:hypothetical protein